MSPLETQERKHRYKALVKFARDEANRSIDKTRGVSAIICDEDYRSILSHGYNQFPLGVLTLEERKGKRNKLIYTIHAEVNAIAKAAKEGIKIDQRVMIIFGKCICSQCALAVIQSGIKTIHIFPPYEESRWYKSNTIALQILKEAEVKVIFDDSLA